MGVWPLMHILSRPGGPLRQVTYRTWCWPLGMKYAHATFVWSCFFIKWLMNHIVNRMHHLLWMFTIIIMDVYNQFNPKNIMGVCSQTMLVTTKEPISYFMPSAAPKKHWRYFLPQNIPYRRFPLSLRKLIDQMQMLYYVQCISEKSENETACRVWHLVAKVYRRFLKWLCFSQWVYMVTEVQMDQIFG